MLGDVTGEAGDNLGIAVLHGDAPRAFDGDHATGAAVGEIDEKAR
jgi:hypothetical protein